MSQLLNVTIDTKLKLSALWISIMFCLIYSDYFGLFTPGAFETIRAIRADPESQGFLRVAFVLEASPILMIFLSVVLSARYNRIINIVVGAFFVLGIAFSIFVDSSLGTAFNVTIPLSAVKILKIAVASFAALVVWYAWKWPKTQNAA
jgi:hypothetical protein